MKKSKVVAHLCGGLGNQLFIYAAAMRLAEVHGAELVLDDISGFENDHEFQRCYQLGHFHVRGRRATRAERLEPFSNLRRAIARRLNASRPFSRRHYVFQTDNEFDPRLLAFTPRGTVYMQGYWQDERYFFDVERQLRNDLVIKPPQDHRNQEMANAIRRTNAVAMHIRLFEGVGSPEINNLPIGYYRRAAEAVSTKVANPHYFIFCDQPDAVRQRLPLSDNNFTVVGHNIGEPAAHADLWLMSLCQHFIIANSTFSWWGAWLGGAKEKLVIAPGKASQNAGSWGFDRIVLSQWIQV